MAKKHLPGLDLLRAAAILLVLLAHYPKANEGLVSRILNFGWTGVDLFFVLSGFLIGSQVFQPLAAGRDLPLKDFYLKRLLRTLPPYYAILLVYFGLARFLPHLQPAPSFLYFTQNFGIPRTFTASWSLCVEEQFYLVFPLVALLFPRLRTVRALAYTIFGFLVCAAVVRIAVWVSHRPDLLAEPQALDTYMRYLYYPTYCRLDGIALGVGLAAIRCFHPTLWRSLAMRGNHLIVAAAAFLLLAIVALWKHYSLACSTVGFTFLNLSFASLALSAAGGSGILARLRIPGVPYLAAISYSVYLTHSLALDLTERFLAARQIATNSWMALGIIGSAIFLSAACLYYLVERRSLRLRDRLLRGTPRPRPQETILAAAPEEPAVQPAALP